MCFSPLDNSALVASNEENVVTRNVDSEACKSKFTATTETTGNTSSAQENETSGLSVIRDIYKRQGLEEATIDIIMNSWRPGTKTQYETYVNSFITFSTDRYGVFKPSLYTGLSFLTSLATQQCSYNQIAMARSALSTIIDLNNSTFRISRTSICQFWS